jgi:hypothetical protein
MYISQDPIGLGGGRGLYLYVHNTNGWIDALGLKQHTMTGTVVRDGVALDGVGGTYTSGEGSGSGKKNQVEAQATHTEQQFLRDVRPVTEPGDHLVMNGELNPCARGRGCQPAIRDQVAATGVSAEYNTSSTGKTYKWEKIGDNKVLQTEIVDGKVVTQYEYNTETRRRKQVSLCES